MNKEDRIKEIEAYKQYARKPAKNQVVRLDLEHFKDIEVIRMKYSNQFVVPSTSEIIRVVLKHYVNEVIEPAERDLLQEALYEVMNSLDQELEQEKK